MTFPDRPTLSVVAPCFNEQAVLPEFLRRVGAVLDGIGGSAEIVVVDDGSSDGTWAVMTEAAARDPRVVAVRLMRNHGHQLALTAGLSVCRGERILVIDADLQDSDLAAATLLLVDDNQQNLELMQAWLEPLGCTLQIAHDGAEALDLALEIGGEFLRRVAHRHEAEFIDARDRARVLEHRQRGAAQRRKDVGRRLRG